MQNKYNPIEGEIFKQIPEFENYLVSNYGNVVSCKNDIYYTMSQRTTKQGYKEVVLSKNGKKHNFLVHRLVMSVFNPNDNDKMIIRHKNTNNLDNNLTNLEWCFASEVYTNEKANEKIKEIRSVKIVCCETNVIYESMTDASTKTGIPLSNISACCKGRLKSAGGFHWKLVE